ncbi:MAG: hypothetical protein Q9192_002116 [Flavoplaca navasiana]
MAFAQFTKALKDLEGLAGVRAKMNACDRDKLDDSINREIQGMNASSSSALWTVPDSSLQHLQRLIAVNVKLTDHKSKWDRANLEELVTTFLSKSAASREPSKKELKRKRQDFFREPEDRIWSFPIVCFTSKKSRWRQEDYDEPLTFKIGSGDSPFWLYIGEEAEREAVVLWDTTQIIAMTMMDNRPIVRLLPIMDGFNLQSEAFDIEFTDPIYAQGLIARLLELGCTVIQRPQGAQRPYIEKSRCRILPARACDDAEAMSPPACIHAYPDDMCVVAIVDLAPGFGEIGNEESIWN